MKYQELESRVFEYADNNDLLESNNLLSQSYRLKRSMDDLHTAAVAKNNGFKEYIDNTNTIGLVDENIQKGLGKILFELIILSEINGVSLENMLEDYLKNKE